MHRRRTAGVNILLVEDNPGDVRLTREALRDSQVESSLHAVADGVEAMNFLRNRDGYAAAPRPDLILLDLDLPRMDGRAVLHEIKQDDRLRAIPVVVLSTSKDEQEIRRTYDLHANCFVSKPFDLDEFSHVVAAIEYFWFAIVRLPGDAT